MRNPDLKLLLLASRERIAPETRDRIARLLTRCPDDGQPFVRHCMLNATYPLVLNTLKQQALLETNAFTRNVHRQLQEKCRQHVRARIALARAQRRVTARFAENHVPCAILRGLALAQRFWQSPQLRVCGDLDLLVPESSREAAHDLLLQTGFSFREDDERRRCRAQFIGQTEFYSESEGITIDLNWRLTGNAGIGNVDSDIETLWQRALPSPEGGFLLTPEDVLLDVARHFCHGHDYGQRLIKACIDVQAIITATADKLDWDYIFTHAQKAQFIRGFAHFAWMYENWFREPDEPSLPASSFAKYKTSPSHSRLFSNTLCLPRIRLNAKKGNRIRALIMDNLGIAAKFAALDSAPALFRVAKVYFWPAETEMRLLHESLPQNRLIARIKQTLYAASILPGILAGASAFLAARCRPGPPPPPSLGREDAHGK